MLKKIANFVVKHLSLTNILKRPVVQSPVEKSCLGKRVKSIKSVGNADVYCLLVPETHNFIANGMVVHNSIDALRYACFTHFYGKDGSRLSSGEIERMRNEVYGGYSFPKPFIDPNEQNRMW